jgi:ATP-dependent DNA helicase RecQ
LLGLCETSVCRRARLLSYFGETHAAMQCGNCDNCIEPPHQWDATEPSRMALSAIYRTGQRFGAAYIIDVLRGAATENIRTRGHANLPVYGIGKNIADRTWRNVLRQLITHGWVHVDVQAYGALTLTETSRPVLRGEVPVMLRPERVEETAPKAVAKTRRTSEAPANLNASQTHLLETLKAWRLETARTHRLPAYVILHDRVLVEIATMRPDSLSQLANVSGIGQAKIDRYGSAILACVRAV